jgi:hypothetical protein
LDATGVDGSAEEVEAGDIGDGAADGGRGVFPDRGIIVGFGGEKLELDCLLHARGKDAKIV